MIAIGDHHFFQCRNPRINKKHIQLLISCKLLIIMDAHSFVSYSNMSSHPSTHLLIFLLLLLLFHLSIMCPFPQQSCHHSQCFWNIVFFSFLLPFCWFFFIVSVVFAFRFVCSKVVCCLRLLVKSLFVFVPYSPAVDDSTDKKKKKKKKKTVSVTSFSLQLTQQHDVIREVCFWIIW